MFQNRTEAGILLAERLGAYKDAKDVSVLALPRGGVVPGFEIATRLHLPLDVVLVRKIGFPGQPELGIGAIAETGAIFLNRDVISTYGVQESYLQKEISRQKEEISRRIALYRGGKRLAGLEGRTVILVDDGIATGGTLRAGITALKEQRIRKLVIALPVAPMEIAREFESMADEFICLETPVYLGAVGSSYLEFDQVPDEVVIDLLRRAAPEIK